MAKHTRSVSSQSCPSSKKTKISLPSSSYTERYNPLSNLLPDIIQNIFTFLPIKEAIGACTVSTWFKKSWTLNRKLMFAHEFHRSTENLIALVDHVFNSHEGSVIQCFQLHMSQIGAEEMIEKWLKICIQKGVQELDFNFFQRGYVLVPELLQIPTLKILKLSNVQFGVQPVTNGWQNLHTVILREMELYEEQLENVMLYGKMIQCLDLGSCREIRRISIFASEHKNFRTLKITTCPNLEKIEIDAPTLQHIHYCGFVVKLEFTQVVPSLSEAKFIFFRSRNYLKIPILENLVNHLHNVRVLTTSAQFQEALSYRFRDGVFQVPQFYFSNIRELHIVMDGANFCNPYDIIVFLKNCPSIEMLFIDLNDYHFECGTYWEMHQKPILEAFNQQFDGLKVIKLIGFKFLESELQLLEILLKRSRILETLIFTTPKNARIKIYEPFIPKYKDLIQSWKASPSAKVGLFENSNDKSGIYPSHEKKWYY